MDERWRGLLAGYVDNELFERELAANAELRAELDQFRKLKRMTGTVRYADLPDEVWESYWSSLYRKMERGLGWFLASAGAVVLLCYGLFQALEKFLLDPTVPLLIKFGMGALVIGLVILLVSLIRERYFAYKHDRYREVIR
jgi:hypothetical protein